MAAKLEIYHLMDRLAARVRHYHDSSELPEVIGMSDRIYIMHEGEIVDEASEEQTDSIPRSLERG